MLSSVGQPHPEPHAKRARAESRCEPSHPSIWNGCGRPPVHPESPGSEHQPARRKGSRVGKTAKTRRHCWGAIRRPEESLQGDVGRRCRTGAENRSRIQDGGGTAVSVGEGNGCTEGCCPYSPTFAGYRRKEKIPS